MSSTIDLVTKCSLLPPDNIVSSLTQTRSPSSVALLTDRYFMVSTNSVSYSTLKLPIV